MRPRNTPADNLALKLQERIIGGSYEGRNELPSAQELAWEFQVSLRTVREAFGQLESLGLAQRTSKGLKPHPASRSGSLDLVGELIQNHSGDAATQYLVELLELYRFALAQTAALSAERREDGDLSVLERDVSRLLEGMDQQIAPDELFLLEQLFWCDVSCAARNIALGLVVRSCHRYLSQLPERLTKMRVSPLMLPSEFEDLVTAIQDGEPAHARTIVDASIRGGAEVWVDRIRSLGRTPHSSPHLVAVS